MTGDEQAFREEVVVSSFPPVADLIVTTNGHFCGFRQEADDRIRFVWDGSEGEPFDQLLPMRDGTTEFWSTDGEHVAYIGLRGGRSFVGRDAHEDPPFEAPTRSVPPVFSADGAHLAYGAQIDGVVRLVLDGKPVSEAPLAPIAAALSPDGNRVAYAELQEIDGEKLQFRIVVDGRAGEWFRGMRNAVGVLQFSPDSRRFAYYRITEKLEGQWVVDGVEQRWTNDVRPLTFARLGGIGALEPPMVARFSPDSTRFAYWADVKEKGVAVIENDVAGPLMHGAGWPIFSADSKHLAYVGQTFKKQVVAVVDGIPGREWPAPVAGDPVFSPDSQHVAVVLRREEGSFLRKRQVFSVVMDDQVLAEQPGDDASEEPVFSSDGKRVAWWLHRGADWFVFVGDQPGPRLDRAGTPRFSSSGRVVHLAGLGKSNTLMIDGQPGPLALAADAEFGVSADGEHVAWTGQFPDGVHPVLDAQIGPPFEWMAGGSFLDDGSVRWWGRRGDVVSRISAHI